MSQGSTVFQRIMCVPGEHVCPRQARVFQGAHVGSEGICGSSSLLPLVCPRDRTQVIRLGNKPPPPPSHLTDPELIPLRNQNQVKQTPDFSCLNQNVRF